MQQKLNRENLTKTEPLISAFHKEPVSEDEILPFYEPYNRWQKINPPLPELKEGLWKLQKKLNTTQNSLDEFWLNVTDVWPNSQKVSVYESLIERVASTEKYVAAAIEMVADLRSLILLLENMVEEFVKSVDSQKEEHINSMETIHEELKRNEKEIKHLKEEQAVFAKDKARQYDMLMLIFGFQLVTLVVCVALSCCHRPVYIEARAGSERGLMANVAVDYKYTKLEKKRCFSAHEY